MSGLRQQGLNFSPFSLMADRDLRRHIKPISCTTMDWMHNFLVNGLANLEFHLFLCRARAELGVRYAQLHAFATAAWAWPRWQATHKATFQFVTQTTPAITTQRIPEGLSTWLVALRQRMGGSSAPRVANSKAP